MTEPIRVVLRRHRLFIADWGRHGTAVKCDREAAGPAAADLRAAGVPAVVECSTVTLSRTGSLTLGRWEECRCDGPGTA